MKYQLIGLGGSSQFCDLCGNDFGKNPGGVVVEEGIDIIECCSWHVPKMIQLGESFDSLEKDPMI